ncbi:MAG: polyprenyl synthetase family protein [bacterium]|nr:polyprenyl synthetase family protein [bacterium]
METLTTDIIGESREYLDSELSEVKNLILELTTGGIPVADDVFEYTVESGGKGVRPRLVLLSHRAAGGDAPEAIEMAAAMELVHIATLLHDDVIDGSETRRGRPSVNAKWDNHIAVLAGDYLYTKVFQRILAVTQTTVLVDLLAYVTNEMTKGEFYEIWMQGDIDVSEDDYFSLIRMKTAVLIEACTRSGALLAGNDYGAVETLSAFGLNMGMAFQIGDDCMDIVGCQEDIGKDTFSDIKDRKLTLPFIYSLNGYRGVELKEMLSEVWSDNGRCLTDIAELLTEDGSLERALDTASNYAQSAKDALVGLNSSRATDLLAGFADWAWQRKR